MTISIASPATAAVLTLAEIKSAAAAFDRGEANIGDTLDAICIACDAYLAMSRRPRQAA